jgi:hypothetical protein
MTGDAIPRVHYFEGQVLRLQDFVDEQAHHLSVHRRHNVGHHVWGIVAGLWLRFDEEDGALYVETGAAVDGFGRWLLLPHRQPLGREAFADRNSDVLDVYLNYNRSGSDQAPSGFAGCDDRGDPPFYRWLEQPYITMEMPGTPPVDHRRPARIAAADLGFEATRLAPDEPERRWPVFLGQVTLDRANEARPFAIDLAGRPYAALVGEAVYAPSGRAAVQVGAERPDDPNRFAVFVREAEPTPAPGQPIEPRLAIARDGTHRIRGDTILHGNLTVQGHAVEFQAGPERTATDPPWRIYHVATDQDAEHELRIEMARPPDGQAPAGDNRVVVGTWARPPDEEGGQEAFQACLTVADDCTVTVHGNLVLENPLVYDRTKAVDAGLGSDAKNLVLAAALSGVTGSGALVSSQIKSAPPSSPVVLNTMLAALAPEQALQAAANLIAADPNRATTFAELLKDANEATDRLRQALSPPTKGTGNGKSKGKANGKGNGPS